MNSKSHMLKPSWPLSRLGRSFVLEGKKKEEKKIERKENEKEDSFPASPNHPKAFISPSSSNPLQVPPSSLKASLRPIFLQPTFSSDTSSTSSALHYTEHLFPLDTR
ncbi:unnamed protein product [Victoria cruziana]